MAFRFFCRKQGPGGDYCLTVRAGKLCLALPNDSDAYQLWYKENCSDGSPLLKQLWSKENCLDGFMLVNKATNKVARHLSNIGTQLYLVDKPSYVDRYVLWMQSIDFGCGYRYFGSLGILTGGIVAQDVFDGSSVSLFPYFDPFPVSEKALWKPVPVPTPTPTPAPAPAPATAPAPTPVYTQPSNMIYCLAGDAQYCIAIKAGNIVLASPNPNDPTQQWYKDDTKSNKAGSFMLVNKSNFQAAKQSSADQPLKLANRPITPDNSFLWTESETDGYGFTYLVTATNSGLAMDARSRDGKETHDDKYVSFSKNLKGDNQKWKFIS